MCTWAEHRFRLSKTDDKGTTVREHLEQVERQLGYKPTELEEPNEFPSVVTYIWAVFCRLSNRRTSNETGVNPISFTEIKAWKDLLEVKTQPWEIEAILKLDEVYLRVTREK